MRRVADINEIIDIMSSIKGGAFATVCYLSSAKVGKTLTGKNVNVDKFGTDLDSNRIDGDDEIYNSLKAYQQGGASRSNKFPFGGIVKMTRYQFHWQTEDKYNKNYSDYAEKRDKLLAKYGASVERRDGYDSKQDFGKGGVSVGSTDNTQGRLYSHQNGATAKKLSEEYYVVDNNGEMKGGISYGAIKSIVAAKSPLDGVGALRKINASDEQIEEYTRELRELKFSVLKLFYDSILFIIASANGEKVYFINDKLANAVGSGSYIVNINPQSFLEKARELYRQSNAELNEIITNRRDIIKETIRDYLSEMDWRTYDQAANKAEEFADDPHITRYEMERRQNQARDLRDYAHKMLNKQYGIDKIKQREDDYALQKNLGNKNFQEPFKHTNGELKRLDRQMNDLMDYNDGKQEYNKTLGKWMNKDENPFDGTFHESRNVGKSKAIFRMTESDLHAYIGNAVKKYLVENMNLAPWQQRDPVEDEDEIRLISPTEEEASFKNNQGYSHFAISKKNGKILNGWDYSDYDPSELRQFKKDYFDDDLIDYGFNPKNCRILTYKYLIRNGIDPDDNGNWANNDEANEEFVG